MDDVVGQAWYELGARMDKLEAELKKAEGDIGKSGKKGAEQFEKPMLSAQQRVSEGFGKVKTALAAIGIGLGLATVMTFFSGAINQASDLNETVSKTQVVFGDASASVLKMGEDSARAMGLSKNAALGAAATYGNLFRAIGLTADKSAEMSTRLVQLASDLASFNNADPTEVLEALRSGLVGETEPLRKFGININDARLRQEALNLGLKVGSGVLDSATKAQAAYSLMLKDTTLAQGDYARTASGLANTQRTNAAIWEDTQARIGQALLPVMTELAHFAGDVMPSVGDAIVNFLHVAEPLVGLLVELAKLWIEHADVIVPLVAVAYGVKLVNSLKAAELGEKALELAAKSLKAALLLGIPVVVEWGDSILDVIAKFAKSDKDLQTITELADALGVSFYEAARINKQLWQEDDPNSAKRLALIGQLEGAAQRGEDWRKVLEDLKDGHLDMGRANEAMIVDIQRETREMQNLASSHGTAAAEIQQASVQVNEAILDELAAVDKSAHDTVRVVTTTAAGLPGMVAATLSNGSTVIATESGIPEAVRAALKSADEAAKQEAVKIPGDIAKSILEGRNAVTQAATQLGEAATDPLVRQGKIDETRKQIKDLSKQLETDYKKATPGARAAIQAQIDQAKIALAGLLLENDPKSKEAAKLLAKYANSEEPATKAAYEALMGAVEDRADVLKYNVEQDAVATGKALPDALDAAREDAADAMNATRQRVQQEARLDLYDTGSRAGGTYASGVGSEDNKSKAHRAGDALHDAAAAAASQSLYWFGRAVGGSWVQGVIDAMGHNTDSRQRIAQEARLATLDLRGYSPPRTGPLREIDKWGFNVGQAWIGNLVRGLGSIDPAGALGSLSSVLRGLPAGAALAVASGTPAPVAAAVGAAGSTPTTVTYHTEFKVYTQGPTSVETDDDLQRLMSRVLFVSGASGAIGG